jgi:hypothetical protein
LIVAEEAILTRTGVDSLDVELKETRIIGGFHKIWPLKVFID